MGWFYGLNDTRADVVRELTRDTDHLKTHAKYFSGNDLWTVQEARKEGILFICLYMLRKYDGQWGYKPVEASMGPTRVSCPLKFLAMVPCSGETEAVWRPYVVEYWAKRKERLKKRRAWLDHIEKGVAYMIDQRGNVVN